MALEMGETMSDIYAYVVHLPLASTMETSFLEPGDEADVVYEGRLTQGTLRIDNTPDYPLDILVGTARNGRSEIAFCVSVSLDFQGSVPVFEGVTEDQEAVWVSVPSFDAVSRWAFAFSSKPISPTRELGKRGFRMLTIMRYRFEGPRGELPNIVPAERVAGRPSEAWQLSQSICPKLLSSNDKTRNTTLSPTCLADAVDALIVGSAGQTRTELKRLVVTRPNEQRGEKDPTPEGCESARAVWLDASARPSEIFARECAALGTPVETCDLSRPESGKLIAAWIRERTRGLLEPHVVLSQNTIACLVSVFCFKDSWEDPFDPDVTEDGDFRLESGGISPARFMRTLRYSHLVEFEGCRVTSLPFSKGSNMVFVLPKEGASVDDALTDGTALRAVRTFLLGTGHLPSSEVEFAVPRFDFSTCLDELERDLAGEGPYDLTPMTGESEAELRIVHEARVLVTEEGAEAAAYTMVLDDTGAPDFSTPPLEFALDRPFVFVIASEAGEPLFIGIVRKP